MNSESHNLSQRKYYQRNRNRINETRRKRWATNVENGLCSCGQPRFGNFVTCRICYEDHKTTYNKNREQYNLNRNHKLQTVRETIYAAYGGTCACPCRCGESTPEFLQIDHVNNDGADQRRQLGSITNIYRWIIEHKFPPSLQLLCSNCHNAKTFRGGCPHQGKS